MDVRGEPPLRLDDREILQVIADEAAQVLDEPVEQRGVVQSIARQTQVAAAQVSCEGAVIGDVPTGFASGGPHLLMWDIRGMTAPRRNTLLTYPQLSWAS